MEHYRTNILAMATMSSANLRYSFDDPSEWLDEDEPLDDDIGLYDDEGNAVSWTAGTYPPVTGEDEGGDDLISLAKLGTVDPVDVLDAIDEITERYLTNVEGDLIWLMRQGRRPVEISRILDIPECEVVRLRRNCFRKIRVVFMFDYYRDKRAFLQFAVAALALNEKQQRILTMFFDYYGLRPIAEVIGTRASNIHRSLEAIRTRLDTLLSEDSEYRPFLAAFSDFKYLNLLHRAV